MYETISMYTQLIHNIFACIHSTSNHLWETKRYTVFVQEGRKAKVGKKETKQSVTEINVVVIEWAAI